MPGPNHDFLIIESGSFSFDRYDEYQYSPDRVELHDDIFCHFFESLHSLPCYAPIQEQTCKGLCWNGPTLIAPPSARILSEIVTDWLQEIEAGSARQSFRVFANDEIPEGYDIPLFEKEELIRKLQKLIAICETVANSNDKMTLLHLGI